MDLTGFYQDWECELDINDNKSVTLSCKLQLKMWPGGGITGVKRSEKAQFHRSELHSEFDKRESADIFGTWNQESLQFILMFRNSKYGSTNQGPVQVKGKWDTLLESVTEGHISVVKEELGSTKRLKPIGTGKLWIQSKAKENKEEVGEFVCNLREYVKNPSPGNLFFDFKIVTKDETISAHKIILASQTKYFGALFRQENPDMVSFSEFEDDAVRQVVNFLYTGEINITGDNVQDIMMFANYTAVQKVVQKCEQFINNNLDGDNCLGVLKLGDIIGNKVISEAAKLMVCRNFQEICKSPNFYEIPFPLLKDIFSGSKNLTLRGKFGTILGSDEMERQIIMDEVVNMMPEGHKEELIKMKSEEELSTKKLIYKRVYASSCILGRPGDNPTELSRFDISEVNDNKIRTINISTVLWDDHKIVGGIELIWSDGTSDKVGNFGEDVQSTTGLAIDEGDHVVMVFSNSGWYVDNLAFLTSRGKLLGPVGGGGGGIRNTVGDMRSDYNCANVYLSGVKGREVTSQGVKLVTNLQFLYSCATQSENPKFNLDDEAHDDMESLWHDNIDEDWINEEEYEESDSDSSES